MSKQPKQSIVGTYGPMKMSVGQNLPNDWEFRIQTGEVNGMTILVNLEVTQGKSGYNVRRIYSAPSLLEEGAIIQTSKTFPNLSKAMTKRYIAELEPSARVEEALTHDAFA